jgi:hypothetical protein
MNGTDSDLAQYHIYIELIAADYSYPIRVRH